MKDQRQEKKGSGVKINELILSAKNLSYQINKLKRENFLREKVIDLAEYRKIRNSEKGKRALLVDEDKGLISELGRGLEESGYEALIAEDSEKLARVIESETFDLMLIDVGLSWVDGMELCRLMKGNKFLRDIPILFMSKEHDRKKIRKAFEYGCDEYIIKPFKIERVIRTLRYFLENY